MRQEADPDITKALEDVYATEDSSIDPGLAAAQRRATAEEW